MSVALVGAGPGDPELVTVRGLARVRAADVLVYDRLVAPELVARAAGATRIARDALTQAEVNEVLVHHARRGRAVVRLKGGDPFVFGRGGEEVEACRRAGIPVSVIPGVTSAVAVPAAAGIPVTHRSASRMFTVVSGHAPLAPAELEHLAGLGGTIVILMGITNLPSITAGLARFGMDPEMPVAVVEQGFSTRQRTTFGDLRTILTESVKAGVGSPAVVVIGEVVRLARGGDAGATTALADAAAVTGG